MAVLTKKIRVLPVGDKEEIDRVYQYLRDAQYEQYRYMNNLMNQLAAVYYRYNGNIKDARFEKAIKGIYASTFKEHDIREPAAMRVRQDFSAMLKHGFTGENMPQYRRSFPLLVQGTLLTPCKESKTYVDKDNNEQIVEGYYINFVNGIKIKLYIPKRHWSEEYVTNIFSAIDHIIAGDEEYKFCDSQIKIEDDKIYLYMTIKYPYDNVYKPIPGKTMNVVMGSSSPVTCYIPKDNKICNIGNSEELINARKQMAGKYKYLQESCKDAAGNKRKRKLEALQKCQIRETNYQKTYMHCLSKQIVDLAVENKVSCIIIETPSTDIIRETPIMLRDWSCSDMVKKVKYKAANYHIAVIPRPGAACRICSSCSARTSLNGSVIRLHPEDYWNTSAEFICPVCGLKIEYGANKAKLLSQDKRAAKKKKKQISYHAPQKNMSCHSAPY